MPKKIQEAVTALKLIRKFGLVGAFTTQLDETIVPTVIVDDLTIGEQWQYAYVHDERAWVVAQRQSWQLHNPPDSGRVIQLLQFDWWDDVAQQVTVYVNDVSANLVNALAPQFQELYEIVLAADAFPTAEVNHQSLVGLFTGPIAASFWAEAGVTYTWTPKHTLLYPGASIWFQPNVVAEGAAMNMQWRERNQHPDGT